MPYANIKGTDQPASPRSLISALCCRYLDSIMPTLLNPKFQVSILASVAEQAGLSLSSCSFRKLEKKWF